MSFINSVLQSTCWERSHLLHVFCFCFHLTFSIKQDFRDQNWSALFILLLCALSCISQCVNSRSLEVKYILIADFCLSEEGRKERQPFRKIVSDVSQTWISFCKCYLVPRILAFRSQILHHFFIITSTWNVILTLELYQLHLKKKKIPLSKGNIFIGLPLNYF